MIPSAPAGVGVIELVASGVLVSLTVAGPTGPTVLAEHTAMAMVLTQHVMQFLVVGIPGVIALLLVKKQIGEISSDQEEPE